MCNPNHRVTNPSLLPLPTTIPAPAHHSNQTNKQQRKMIAINFFLVLALLVALTTNAHNVPYAHHHDQFNGAGITKKLTKNIFTRGLFQNEKIKVRVNSNLRTAAATSNDPATLIAYQYSSSNNCEGNANIASGYPFHVCMTGYAEDGHVAGSGIYQAKSQDAQYLYVSYTEFSSADCTGNPSFTDSYNFPLQCIGGENTDPNSLFQSFRVSLVPGTDISSYLQNGVLFSYYDSNDHCSAHAASSSYTWVSLNQCMPGDDGSSFQFQSCGAHKVSASLFSDNQCTVPVTTSDMPLVKCVADDEPVFTDSGMSYGIVQSGECI